MSLRDIAIDLIPGIGIFTSGRRAIQASKVYDDMEASALKGHLSSLELTDYKGISRRSVGYTIWSAVVFAGNMVGIAGAIKLGSYYFSH